MCSMKLFASSKKKDIEDENGGNEPTNTSESNNEWMLPFGNFTWLLKMVIYNICCTKNGDFR